MLGSAGIYMREQRQVAILVDGDEEGNKRKRRIEQWADSTKRKCPVLGLADYKAKDCSIEDFLHLPTLKDATVLACKEAIADAVIKPKVDSWEADLKKKMDANGGISLGKHLEQVLEELFDQAISDVWIARKYAEQIQQRPAAGANIDAYWHDESLLKLAKAIWESLELPKRGADVASFVA
jgi:hypothetical protein